MPVWARAFLRDGATVRMVTQHGEPGLDGNPLTIGKCIACGHTQVLRETADDEVVTMGPTDDCACGGDEFVLR